MADDSELGQLRARFPTWHISQSWTARGSGPDACKFTAKRDGETLSAFSIAALAQEIERAEASE